MGLGGIDVQQGKEIKFDFTDTRELDHRFKSNIVGIKETDCILPFKIINVTGRNSISGRKYDIKRKMFGPELDYPIDFKSIIWSYPTLGYINMDNSCYYTSRMSAGRVYTRGLTTNTLTVNDSFLLEKHIVGSDDFIASATHRLAYAIWNNEYVPFNAAYASLESSAYLARAISENFAIGLKATCENICLFYKGVLIGECLNDNTVLLHLGFKHLHEMVEQLKITCLMAEG